MTTGMMNKERLQYLAGIITEARHIKNSNDEFLNRYFHKTDEDRQDGITLQNWEPNDNLLVTVPWEERGFSEYLVIGHIVRSYDEEEGTWEYEIWVAQHGWDEPINSYDTSIEPAHLTVWSKVHEGV